MVAIAYVLIILPLLAYVVFTVYEIALAYRISTYKRSRSIKFIQASTITTHALLLFAFVQFMMMFSSLLVEFGLQLWWPAALYTVTMVLRGAMYQLLYYREHSRRFEYGILLANYLVGLAAIAWMVALAVLSIMSRGYVPDTTNMPVLLSVGLPILAACVIPLMSVYRKSFEQFEDRQDD